MTHRNFCNQYWRFNVAYGTYERWERTQNPKLAHYSKLSPKNHNLLNKLEWLLFFVFCALYNHALKNHDWCCTKACFCFGTAYFYLFFGQTGLSWAYFGNSGQNLSCNLYIRINAKGFSEKNSTLIQNFLKNELWSWGLTLVWGN